MSLIVKSDFINMMKFGVGLLGADNEDLEEEESFPGRRMLAQKWEVGEYINRALDKLFSQNESTFWGIMGDKTGKVSKEHI